MFKLALLSVAATAVLFGVEPLTPDESAKYPLGCGEYGGIFWRTTTPEEPRNDIIRIDAVKLSEAHEIEIDHSVSFYPKGHPKYTDLTDYKVIKRKIIIEQETPCYIIPKNQAQNVKKINDHTVEAIIPIEKVEYWDTSVTTVMARHRRGLLYLKLHTDKTYERYLPEVTTENSDVILGDFECLNNPNKEKWTVWWEIKNDFETKWIPAAEENLTILP